MESLTASCHIQSRLRLWYSCHWHRIWQVRFAVFSLLIFIRLSFAHYHLLRVNVCVCAYIFSSYLVKGLLTCRAVMALLRVGTELQETKRWTLTHSSRIAINIICILFIGFHIFLSLGALLALYAFSSHCVELCRFGRVPTSMICFTIAGLAGLATIFVGSNFTGFLICRAIVGFVSFKGTIPMILGNYTLSNQHSRRR